MTAVDCNSKLEEDTMHERKGACLLQLRGTLSLGTGSLGIGNELDEGIGGDALGALQGQTCTQKHKYTSR